MKRSFLLPAVLLGSLAAQAQPAEELDFLTGLNDFREVRQMLGHWLNRQAAEKLARRRADVRGIATVEDLRARQTRIREQIVRSIGGLPERTPLNPRVTGTLKRDGYKIEKVIFESQPGFFVTANLYLPTRGQAPYPAVLFPLGHEDGAKAHSAWQQVLVTLVQRGYVALTWDPLGQGERLQFYDADWQDSKLHSSTLEHTELGMQCLLVGDAMARYTIWDGLRALDYLLSRPEVDPKRVAATGNSGGGTHTSYISALDDRVQVAAPSCYITSWNRMLASLGPQDAEQIFPGWIGAGFDYPDFIYAFGPKPFKIMSAIRDFFPIMGARESYAEVRETFTRLGVGDRIAMFAADDGHGYTAPRRAAGYEWLGQWLKGAPDREPETPVKLETYEDLRCTAGQVSGETVFTLNQKRAATLRSGRNPVRAVEQARALSGFAPATGPLAVESYGVIQRDGYRIEKLTYESAPGILVPALLYVPSAGPARKPAVLVLDGAGKSASAAQQEKLAKAGAVVLSIDARGLGETRPQLDRDEWTQYFGDYANAMTAVLLGKTLVGLRAEDVVRGLDLLAARPEVDAGRIAGYGKGPGAVPLLHAAAFDQRLCNVLLDHMLISYEAVVDQRLHRQIVEQVVPGALRAYDLPDLVASLAPRKVLVVDPVNPLGNLVHESREAPEITGLLR